VPELLRGLGLGTTDHRVPFQRSMRGTVGDAALGRSLPTAMQLCGVAHETATSALASMWGRAGLDTTDQPRPFQRSMSGRVCPFSVIRLPTAKQVAVTRVGR
jgi:hypothetical protein